MDRGGRTEMAFARAAGLASPCRDPGERLRPPLAAVADCSACARLVARRAGPLSAGAQGVRRVGLVRSSVKGTGRVCTNLTSCVS